MRREQARPMTPEELAARDEPAPAARVSPPTTPQPCGRTDIVTTVDGRELLFRCDREAWHHDGRHHAVNVDGVEVFWSEHRPAIGLSSAGRHTLCMGCGEPWPCRAAARLRSPESDR